MKIANPLNRIKLSEKFITVLTCSSDKQENSEMLYFNNNVPQLIELNATIGLRPDDLAYCEEYTWREYIENNQLNGIIPFMAYQLYTNYAYCMLRDAFENRFFIQSAGFGIVRSNYRMPKYNITFKNTKHKLVNLRKYKVNAKDGYLDFNHLLASGNNVDDIVYVGGKEYVKQFVELTRTLPNRKVIFFKGNPISIKSIKKEENFIFHQYYPENPNQRTNWQYGLARDLAHGNIGM